MTATALVVATIATTTLWSGRACAFTTKTTTIMRAPPSVATTTTTTASTTTTTSTTLTTKMGPTNHHALWAVHRNDHADQPVRSSTDPTPILVSILRDVLAVHGPDSSTREQAATATATPQRPTLSSVLTVAALALLWSFAPLSADAALSGGRLGGSFASPRSSSGGSGMSRPSLGGSYRTGYYSRPSITVAPVLPITPYYGAGVSPFGWGVPRPYFFGGPGVITYSRGPSWFDLLLIGGISFWVLNAVRSTAQGTMESTSFWSSDDATQTLSVLGPGTAVVQMSVALQVPNRDDRQSILSVLDRLAQTARTDSRVGLANLSSQVALELLRRKSSIVSASTRYQHFNSRESAQREFNNVSVRERAKFEQETVSKYGGVDYSVRQSSSSSAGGTVRGDGATMAVVTLIFAIDGDATKVPNINSMQDVEAALSLLASNAKVDDCLQAAEILWTPEDRSETLTLREVVADYPELRSV